MLLLPERAVFRENRCTLVVTDVHFRKAASFIKFAIPNPRGMTKDDLSSRTRIIERTGAHWLVILGDLFHAKAGRTVQNEDEVISRRKAHSVLEILHIRCNHDWGAGDPPEDWRIICVDEPFSDNPFVLQHHPTHSDEGYTSAGHLHPSVTLRGTGGQRQRLPCFIFGSKLALLPAFGSRTGTATVRPKRGDRVYVLAEDEVVEVKG
ncbi:MAG: ligase-associated DNA damage response endonuclease PdeM [Deltaproteobacteria bacterium]|nr:MAG: ligase-associated DNA damage response endonuclease PdeM [Deltaproteobacteria bacterium]